MKPYNRGYFEKPDFATNPMKINPFDKIPAFQHMGNSSSTHFQLLGEILYPILNPASKVAFFAYLAACLM